MTTPVAQDFLDAVRASKLPFGPGHPLWTFWTVGKGFAEWSISPTPWQTLHDLLEKYVGPHAAGETTNVMLATPAGRALFEAHHQGGNRAVTTGSGGVGIVAPTDNATTVTEHGNITTPDAGDLNEAARKYAASQGWAMSDGSYPIRPADNHGAADAGKAIHAVGRGNESGDTIRRHIIGRLHTIGQADLIPDTWNAKGALVGASVQSGMRSVATGVDDPRQYRFAADLELRAGGDGRTIVGIAVPYNRPQFIDDRVGVEQFDGDANHGPFDHQLRAMHRVGYWNLHSVHQGVKVGHIKYARNDAAGLYTESFVHPDDPNGDRTLDEIRSGTKPQQSVGFDVVVPSGTEYRDGVSHRVKSDLFELAAVPVGAYGPGASVTAVRAAAVVDGVCGTCGHSEGADRAEQLRIMRLGLRRLS
jgi:uncharacterized protein